MYNGIGLPTPRGSGTNGYVQRNLAFLTTYKDKINYKTDEEVKHTDAVPFKEPNKEILMHEKKRKVEVKCLELQMQMEDQGYTEDEIQCKVSALRKDLLSKLTDVTPKRMSEVFKSRLTIIPEVNRLLPKGTHETAAVSILKNNVFKDALGIGDDYEVGTAMQRAEERRRQAEEAKALFEAQQKLKTLKSSSSEEELDSDGEKKRTRKHKSKKSHKKSHHKKHKRSRKHSNSSEESSSSDSESEKDEVKERKRKHRKHRHHDDKN
nr:Pre mRNA splicing factor cwc 21 [Hymenolepis microstoma]CUU00379.1 Pre mRNA splicing factor cwc 21 [Hymenolepis microstoma]CUU00380.1 Pre mRNA splicing factor cwc 21 [Hymenolepis microstoma]